MFDRINKHSWKSLAPAILITVVSQFVAAFPAHAQDASWSVQTNANGTGCRFESTQNTSTIKIGRSLSLPLDVFSIENPAWHFSDSQSFAQRTLLRYSDGDSVPFDLVYQPEYDGSSVTASLQDLQVSIIYYLQHEKGITIKELVLDVPGPDDLRFDFAGLYEKFPEFKTCVEKAEEPARRKAADEAAAEQRRSDALFEEAARQARERDKPSKPEPKAQDQQPFMEVPGLPGVMVPN